MMEVTAAGIGFCIFLERAAARAGGGLRAVAARHRYGPLEWVWRCATWARRFPLRRGRPGREAAGAVVA